MVENKEEVIKRIETEFRSNAESVDWLDGVSVWFKDWWFNVRPSNTESLLRLNVEADNTMLYEEKLKLLTTTIESFGGKEKI